MELTGGHGGVGLQLIIGDGVDEQLRLALPLCRLLSIPASTLLDQLEDAGEGRIVDIVLRPNPRPRGRRAAGEGGRLPPSSREPTRRKKNRRRTTPCRSGSVRSLPAQRPASRRG
jgi:hypothetical protein